MTKMNLKSKFQGAYSTIDNYLDKAIEKSDATYNMDNIRAGKVGPLETASANFCGYFGMYAGAGFPPIASYLAFSMILSKFGANEVYSVFVPIAPAFLACNEKLCNLSVKACAVAGSKTGAAVGKTIDFIFFKDLKDLFKKKA